MRILQRIGFLAIAIFCAQHMLALDIIPYPLKVETRTGTFALSPSTTILYAAGCRQEANFAKKPDTKTYNNHKQRDRDSNALQWE